MFTEDDVCFMATTEAANRQPLKMSSKRDISYRCGACGYALNLTSSHRYTGDIGSPAYIKAIRKGIVSFYSIDESRFTQPDEGGFFFTKLFWGLLSRRSKLLCRNCGTHIGDACRTPGTGGGDLDYVSGSGNGGCSNMYSIKIAALQPSEEPCRLLIQ